MRWAKSAEQLEVTELVVDRQAGNGHHFVDTVSAHEECGIRERLPTKREARYLMSFMASMEP